MISPAAYSGVLKALLDLLPQYALAGKTVLPLATGGSTAHVLAIDYALRPVLSSMGAAHIVPGWFTLDKDITTDADGRLTVAPGSAEALAEVTDRFSAAPRSTRRAASCRPRMQQLNRPGRGTTYCGNAPRPALRRRGGQRQSSQRMRCCVG